MQLFIIIATIGFDLKAQIIENILESVFIRSRDLKENLNTSKLSEHPPDRGKNCQNV